MLRIYLLLLPFLALTSLQAQSTFAQSFDLEGIDNGLNLIVDSTGYYISGISGCFDNTVQCMGLLKTDADGQEVWRRSYHHSPFNFEVGFDALLKEEHRLLIAAAADSSGVQNLHLMAIDNQGNIEWTREYPTATRSLPRTLFKSKEGHYLIYGFQNSSDGQTSDPILTAVDSMGHLLWERIYEGFRYANPWDIVEFPDGSLAMSLSYCGGSNGCAPYQAAIIRTDAAGEVLWTQSYEPVRQSSRLSRMIALPQGGFALAWNKDYVFDFDHFGHFFPPVVFRLDETGNPLWEYVFNTPADSEKQIIQLMESPDGGIIGVGLHDRFDEYEGIAGWLFKLSAEGVLEWERQIIDPDSPYEHAEFHNIKPTPDGGYILCGYTRDTSKVNGTVMNTNFWLVKLDEEGCMEPGCGDVVSLQNPTSTTFRPSISPNPASTHCHIQLPISDQAYQFELYSIDGKKVLEWAQRTTEKALSLQGQAAGLYWLHWRRGAQHGVERLVIQP